MRPRSLNIYRLAILGMILLAACSLPCVAKEAPELIKAMQTVHLTLDKDQSKDYLISLAKGFYWIIWDGRRTDGAPRNLIGRIQLLKNNGAIVDPTLLNWNEIGVTARTGRRFQVARPLPARLRLHNEQDDAEIWLTVVPQARMKFIPFGFGAPVTPAKLSTEEGVGGSLEKSGVAYHQITLPPGKWSISLGLTRPDGQSRNVMGKVDLLDPYGLTTKPQFIVVNEIAAQARKEATLNVAQPKLVMFRVTNDDQSDEVNYDLTIEKATP
jgi:hypothetical protein